MILRSFQERTEYSDGSDIIALFEEIRKSRYYIPEISFVAKLNKNIIKEMPMIFQLFNITEVDKNTLYAIKKESIKKYVEKIWGWDEGYQLADFEESFILERFKKIMIDDLCIGFIEIQEEQNSINVNEIHIISKYQGMGIGSEIVEGIIFEARKTGKKVTLGCFKENQKAVKFYKKLGFKTSLETETHVCFEKI